MKRVIFAAALLMILIACGEEPQPVKMVDIDVAPPIVKQLPDAPQYEPPPSEPYVQEMNEIKIEAISHEYRPAEIKLKKGELVRLVVTSVDVPHTFTILDYGIDEELPVGQDVEIGILADQEGMFTYMSTTPEDKANNMKGKLIIT